MEYEVRHIIPNHLNNPLILGWKIMNCFSASFIANWDSIDIVSSINRLIAVESASTEENISFSPMKANLHPVILHAPSPSLNHLTPIKLNSALFLLQKRLVNQAFLTRVQN